MAFTPTVGENESKNRTRRRGCVEKLSEYRLPRKNVLRPIYHIDSRCRIIYRRCYDDRCKGVSALAC